jgi:branched-subunit amino acid transport protein
VDDSALGESGTEGVTEEGSGVLVEAADVSAAWDVPVLAAGVVAVLVIRGGRELVLEYTGGGTVG